VNRCNDATIDPRALLPALSRSKLERIIRERVQEGDDSLGRLIVSVHTEKADKRSPTAIVERLLRRHLVRREYGFIEDSNGFAVDLRRIFDRAENAANSGACRFAVELIEKALEVSAPHAFDGADEEGEIMDAVEEGFEKLTEIAQAPGTDPKALHEIGTWALGGVDVSWARDGDSWDMTCLELAALSARDEMETKGVLARCSRFTENRRPDWDWTYLAERAALAAASLLKRSGDEAERREYIKAHLFLSDIRALAVDEAMAAQDYERAIELCKEGLSTDGAGDGKQSTEALAERLIEALDRRGDTKEAARELEGLVIRSFSQDRFDALKKRYAELSSWSEALDRIIAALGKSRCLHALAAIYEAEDMYKRLLALARKDGFLFERYLDMIGRAYPDEASRFLKHKVERELRSTSSRGTYARSAETILQYSRYAGKKAAEALIDSLIAAYSARRAMREELGRTRREFCSTK
jgi:tetratricopeptide (TPR) repeat protein